MQGIFIISNNYFVKKDLQCVNVFCLIAGGVIVLANYVQVGISLAYVWAAGYLSLRIWKTLLVVPCVHGLVLAAIAFAMEEYFVHLTM